jgi:hypothetical protein
MRFKMMGVGLTATLALGAAMPAIGSANHAGTISNARPHCTARGYHLAGNQRLGFLCLRKHHAPKAPVCRRGLRAQHPRKGTARIRCVRLVPHPAVPLTPVAPPPPPAPPPGPPPPPAPPPVKTPLTVFNICTFNPGLGELHIHESLVYWDNNHDGQVDFGAANLEGNSEVDVAFIYSGPNIGGHLVWIADCPPHESKWINVPLYEREEALHALPPINLEANSAFLNLVAEQGNLGVVWANPEPSVGSVVDNTGQCGDYATNCIVESAYW